ncbi:MAG TPA: 2'-5' RNA ligase family protein [Microvirga sp.]|nr:2'-5' RNA ligase family protein [Microvirga sp.]
MNPAPLILTLALDETSFRFFDEQRRRFFPRERNHIPAHVTLFHALPGDEIDTIVQDLASACAAQPPFPVAVTGLRALGRGVAYQLSASDLAQLRQALARRWADWLTPQDRQKLNPHVTVQNKVDPEEARALLASLQESFEPFMATGEGLDLWWYRGGPWERVERFAFQGRSLPAEASP